MTRLSHTSYRADATPSWMELEKQRDILTFTSVNERDRNSRTPLDLAEEIIAGPRIPTEARP